MKNIKTILRKIIYGAGSLKLALFLVVILIVLSFLAIMFPQQSEYSASEISTWSEHNPGFASIAGYFGLFSVFRSIPFIVVIFFFALNIFICTILHIIELRTNAKLKNNIKLIGFIFLHFALLGILAGGFITTSFGMDGSILLTEGQVFTERADNYMKLSKGALRRKGHKNFMARLNKVEIEYEQKVLPVRVSTVLDFKKKNEEINGVKIEINHPYNFNNIEFTQDEIGYSPRMLIKDPVKKKILLNSFVALKTFRKGDLWEYKDFLPLPFLKNMVYLTLFPDHKILDNKIIKKGELAINPVLLYEERDEKGGLISEGVLPFKGSTRIGGLLFEFHELRYWASFKVVEDPGYLLF
ncbi:MAG: cytochrome c biogenesis protein ResB, partial [Acidobacteriota bacterium]